MELGEWDVRSLYRRMTWEQFLWWYSYSSVEPWGEQRADLRSGIISSVIANVNRDRKRKATPFKPSDFMPKFGDSDRKPLTDRSKWEHIKSIAKSLSATSSRDKAVATRDRKPTA